ncbi:MAG TPA: hypothetical protein VM470_04685 [Acidimicrobiia bacterium]|nr:hypothetical protein [Acidimicrobiia bacterium]
MSDLLTAAASALNAPEDIVKRSAEARAKASGSSVDEVLAAWSGGGTVASTPPPAPTPPPATASDEQDVPDGVAPPPVEAAAPAVTTYADQPEIEEDIEPDEELFPPAPLRERIKVAGRVGALTGAALGLLAVLVSAPWLLPGASVVGEEGSWAPAFEVSSGMFLLAGVLLSILFGIIVAGLSRTIPAWIDPGMALRGSDRTSGWVGAGTGLVLGAIGSATVTSAFGVPMAGEEGRVTLPLLTALVLGLVGGAALGWLTAAFVQALGVPAAVEVGPEQDVSQVRSRLGTAISVPLAGILALLVLVVPFAYILIESNHLTSGGASVLAILTASAILAIAGLSASRPGMRITRGEFLLALTGIGVVVTIIVAVFLARAEPHEEEPAGGTEAVAHVAVL